MFSKFLSNSSKYYSRKIVNQTFSFFSENKTPFDVDKSAKTPFGSSQHTNSWEKKSSKAEPRKPFDNRTETSTTQRQIAPLVAPISVYTNPIEFDKKQNSSTQPQTTESYINSKLGLNRFLSRLYTTTGASLLLSLGSAYAISALPFISQSTEGLITAGLICTIAAFKKAQTILPKAYDEVINREKMLRTKNSSQRLFYYGLGCFSIGLGTAPLFFAMEETIMNILPITMGVTAAIFGGSSLVTFILPKDSMFGYRHIFMGGMVGLVGLNFAGIFASQSLGYMAFASIFSQFQTYLGIGLFSAMIAYDTHVAIKRYQMGDADHLGISIHILLSVLSSMGRVSAASAIASKAQDEYSSKDNEDDKKDTADEVQAQPEQRQIEENQTEDDTK